MENAMFDPALTSPSQFRSVTRGLCAIVLAMALSGLLGVGRGFAQPADEDPPRRPVRTQVPKTIADEACGSGERKVVEIYENGVLVQTVMGGCK
jgi:hypothetical protein